jgi:Uncharacterized protein conserved in bacteria (DUF2252)
MDIFTATRDFEHWFRSHSKIVQSDLKHKHELMKTSPFIMLRGTFYLWGMRFREHLPELCKAPIVKAIGDLHIENFGTWRDAEGRLAWGVNDFDEAYPLPFTNDLVRLCTSAAFAIEEGRLSITLEEACTVILDAYSESIRAGGQPIVLAEHHRKLRRMARARLKDPRQFFAKLDAQAKKSGPVPDTARLVIESTIPGRASQPEYFQRQAGVGSLGRPRYLALSTLGGSRIAREAKVVLPSAWTFKNPEAVTEGAEPKIYVQELADKAIRSHDPFFRVEHGWILRRLAPDCARIELSDLPAKRDERSLLKAMGAETANVHMGSPGAQARIVKYLDSHRDWLLPATVKMVQLTIADWKTWKAGPTAKSNQPQSPSTSSTKDQGGDSGSRDSSTDNGKAKESRGKGKGKGKGKK